VNPIIPALVLVLAAVVVFIASSLRAAGRADDAAVGQYSELVPVSEDPCHLCDDQGIIGGVLCPMCDAHPVTDQRRRQFNGRPW
jgi:hypothetical protein